MRVSTVHASATCGSAHDSVSTAVTNSRAPKRRFTSGRGWERDLPLKIVSTVHRIAQLCASLSLIVGRDGSREHPCVTTLKTKAKTMSCGLV